LQYIGAFSLLDTSKMRSGRRSFHLAAAVSKRFWDKLSPVEQKILNDAANETTRPYQRQTPATAKTVTDKFLSTYDPALAKLYTDELARIQK